MHEWKFFKSARCVQAKVETGDDLLALKELDKKLWTVLSAPTTGVRSGRRCPSMGVGTATMTTPASPSDSGSQEKRTLASARLTSSTSFVASCPFFRASTRALLMSKPMTVK